MEFDVRSVTEEKLGYLLDEGVVKMAKKEGRTIITFDLDFGEIYHEKEHGKVGIIVLRLSNQTPENVNFVLGQFLQKNLNRLKQNTRSLIVIKETELDSSTNLFGEAFVSSTTHFHNTKHLTIACFANKVVKFKHAGYPADCKSD